MDNGVYISLLEKLISIPSFSGKENGTADLLYQFFDQKGYDIQRIENNLIVKNKFYNPTKKTIVLNSHHDTVQPNVSWTYPPFKPSYDDDKLIGLGINDAGASLVSLMAVFDHFYNRQLNQNLVLIASAEEENSGDNGIRLVLSKIDFEIDLAIVGEPTEMKVAAAEKGLLVIDAIAMGQSGHAARPNGCNAIDIAMKDIQNINALKFEKVSDLLGPVVKSVTQIEAGSQHNVIPDQCVFVIDVRINEFYTLEEAFEKIQSQCTSRLSARSFKNRPSGMPSLHPIMKVIKEQEISVYGSPTLSDQAHFKCASIKMGPGKSERSHQADEYVHVSEIDDGISTYIKLLTPYILD